MKTYNIILFILVFLLTVNLASAENYFGSYKVNECVPLTLPCENCTYSTIIMITSPSPNSQIYSLNYSMTEVYNDIFNSTLCDSNYNSKPGTYFLNICGDPDASRLCDNFYYDITTTGQKVSLSNIIIVLAFLVLSIMFFVLGYSFDKEKYILKTSFYIVALIALLLAINSAKIIASESQGLSTMATSGIVLIIALILFMFLYVFVYWMVQTFRAVKNKEDLRWQY